MIAQLVGILLIIVFVFAIKLMNLYHSEGFSNNTKDCSVLSFDTSGLLLTAYPKDITCSLCGDLQPKYVRLNNTGGVMYVSNKKPSESPCCRSVKCPPLMVDDLTPKRIDHYDPYPISRWNMHCYRCD